MALVGSGHVAACVPFDSQTIVIEIIGDNLSNGDLTGAELGMPKGVSSFSNITHIESLADDYHTTPVGFQLVIYIMMQLPQ